MTKLQFIKENTLKHKRLTDHVRTDKGSKTVCVTTCLSFLGIDINSYRFTSTKKNYLSFLNVVRRNGYSVRSRNSEFKIRTWPGWIATANKASALRRIYEESLQYRINQSDLAKTIAKNKKYSSNDIFMVHLANSKTAHLVIYNGDGVKLIDTAPNHRYKVFNVWHVFK